MGHDWVVTSSDAALNGVPALSLTSRNVYDREGRVLRAVRSSSPDPGNIGTIVTQWQYDLVGRCTLEVAPDGQMERTYYDLAGNVDSVRTRRGHVLRMTSGLENQLLARAVPSATYTDALAGIGAADGQPYPLRPNVGASYVIAADTNIFTYDAVGRMTTANNGDAHVSRSYFPGGGLRTEQQDLRDAVGTAFSHQYLLTFPYDRDGRRRGVKLPSQLVSAGTTDSIVEQYDGTTLELSAVTDPLGHVYSYQYTNRSQPSVLTYPGNYQRRWTYNTADRDSTDAVVNTGGTTGGRVPLITLRSSTFTNDARGNRLTTDDAFGLQERQRFAYAGLGHVVMSNLRQFGRVNYPSGNAPVVALTGEALSYAAFGNVITVTTGDTLRANSATGPIMSASKTAFASTYQTAVGRLVSQNSGAKTFRYDAAGNLNFVTLSASGSAFHDDRFAYYAADGRLRASDYRSQKGGINVYAKWVFETYRYDALGRRVWVRTDRKCTLPVPGAYDAEWLECDLSTLRRTVWDRERELIELQVPVQQAGATTEEAASTLENDVYVPNLPRAQGNDQNPFFGRVVYTHGLTTDEPIGLTRYNYVDLFNVSPTVVAFPPTGISLVWNALGKMNLAICGDGQQECTASANGRTANMWFGVPAGWFVYERPTFVLNAFQGTLVRDKQDATRRLYRRSRYYDQTPSLYTHIATPGQNDHSRAQARQSLTLTLRA